MTKRINKDTQVRMSPRHARSNFGTRFHNYLVRSADLTISAKAFSPTDLRRPLAAQVRSGDS